MAGHSHSANIKYRKDRVNAAKAKVFSKLARMITVAAKLGGGDPDANPRLRLALDKARVASMPKDNIERAIKKGVGGDDDKVYEEILYEGYAPHGVAVMMEILTDNRNRTAPEIRHVFDKRGGNLGNSGAVAWMFERKAVVVLRKEGFDEERLFEVAIEAGAEDVVDSGMERMEVRCEPADLTAVQDALVAAELPVEGGEVRYVPTTTTEIQSEDQARSVLRCLDALEELDDVQAVYSNESFGDDILRALTENP